MTKNIFLLLRTCNCVTVLESMNNFKTKKLNFEHETVIYIDEMPTFFVLSFYNKKKKIRYSTLMIRGVNTIFLFIVFNRCAFHKNWKLIYILVQLVCFPFPVHAKAKVLFHQDFIKFPGIFSLTRNDSLVLTNSKTFTITTDIMCKMVGL